MADTAQVNSASRTPARLAQPLLGVLVGGVAFYVAALASSAWFHSAANGRVPELLAMLLLAAGSLFLGWRWPRIGLPAGLAVLVIVTLALAARIAIVGVELASWLDWRSVLAHGGGDVFVPVVGVILVCASITGRMGASRPS